MTSQTTIETVPLPPFLADLSNSYTGSLIALHTGRGTYVGRLISISSAYVTLDADSDALDDQVYMRIDTQRIEAVELLPQ